jgi:hypothetical protein
MVHSDLQCPACMQCDYPSDYFDTKNKECKPTSSCGDDQYQTANPSTFVDTKCADVSVCDEETEYVALSPRPFMHLGQIMHYIMHAYRAPKKRTFDGDHC